MRSAWVWVGIDPGLKGGLAVVDSAGGLVETVRMPTRAKRTGNGVEVDPVELNEWLFKLDLDGRCAVIAVEAQQAMPHQGVSSTFTTGYGMGAIEGVLAGSGHPSMRVRPVDWKRSCGLLGKAKEASIAWCRSRWPEAEWAGVRNKQVMLGLADAACIAYHVWRLEDAGRADLR